MGARKHPLEIFRQNGRTFVAQDEAPSEELAAEMRRGVKGAYLERARELDPDRFRRRPMPVAPAPEGETAGENPSVHGETATASPKRTWKVRPVPANRPGDEGSGSLPLARVGGLLVAALVLIGASTYALGLWPFAPNGVEGDGSRALKNSRLLPDWLNPTERSSEPTGGTPPEGAAGRQGTPDDGGGASPTAGATREAAGAATNVEYWLLAASEKLNTEEKRKDWKQRFGQDKQRVVKALGDEFPGLRIQVCASDAKATEGLLRVGPGTTADDPALLRALTKVRALGGSFSDAFVKKFRKP
jgi:hypothetical protein